MDLGAYVSFGLHRKLVLLEPLAQPWATFCLRHNWRTRFFNRAYVF